MPPTGCSGLERGEVFSPPNQKSYSGELVVGVDGPNGFQGSWVLGWSKGWWLATSQLPQAGPVP